MLEHNFAYVPHDVIVPEILEAGDVAAALSPRALRLNGLVDGLDQLVPEAFLKQQLAPVEDAYRNTPSALAIGESLSSGSSDWFLNHL